MTWDFTLANGEVQFLDAGETLTASYAVTVDDGHGGTASQTVTINVTGANDFTVTTQVYDLVAAYRVGEGAYWDSNPPVFTGSDRCISVGVRSRLPHLDEFSDDHGHRLV